MLDPADEILVRQTLEGKKDAFGILVERYQKAMFNVAYRFTGSMDDAADITQAAFIKAYESLRQFDSKYKFYSWLYRITVNGSLNFINAHQRFEALGEDMQATEQEPDERLDEGETSRAIQRALMSLSPEYRMVVVLSHFQDRSYKEMSEILQIPEKTVKSRLFTARRDLRDILVKEGF